MGSSMESLVGALARGYSGGRCTVAALPLRGSALALRLAEGGRGLCRAQPVTEIALAPTHSDPPMAEEEEALLRSDIRLLPAIQDIAGM